MKNSIFFQPEIKERFLKLSDMTWESMNEDDLHHQYPRCGRRIEPSAIYCKTKAKY